MLRLRTKVTASPTVVDAQLVGDRGDLEEVGTARFEQGDDLVDADLFAGEHAVEHLADRRARPGRPAGGRRRPGGARAARRRRRPTHASSRARPSRSDAHRTAKRTSSCSQRSPSRTYSGYTVRRGASVLPGGLGGGAQHGRAPGQGRSGFTWSGVTGETPPQSSMPAATSAARSSASERLGGACRWIDGSSTSRAAAMVQRNSSGRHAGARHIDGAGLGQEVLDDHLLHVTVARVRGRGWRARASSRSPAGLADADEDAGGERHPGPSRGFEGGEAALGRLVGRTGVRAAGLAEAVGERLDHHPLRRRHRPQPGELVLGERAGVGVGEQAGLVEHRRGGGDQVVDGGRVPARGEPRGGVGVAVLGRLAQGEERLVAAELGAAARDGEHVVELEVGRHEVRGRLGEGAVPALVAAQHRERDEHLRARR